MATRTSSVIFDLLARDVNVTKTIKNLDKQSHGFIGTLGKIAGAFGIAFSVGAVVRGVGDVIHAYADAAAQQGKLADAFTRFPALADTNIKELGKLNTALEHKSRFDDDAIASGQAVLAQYGITGAQLKKLSPLLVDYAAKTGKDLPAAASVLGKAILGQGRGLKDIGVNFKDTGTAAGNFQELVDELGTHVSGFAQKDIQDNADAKLLNLQNRFGDIEEKIGKALMPALDDLATFTETDVLPALDDFSDWFVDYGLPNLEGFFGQVSKYGDILGPAAAAVAILTGVQWGLNVAMDANPLGAVILALEALIGLTAVFGTDLAGVRTGIVNVYGDIAAVILGILGAGAGAFDGYINTIVGGLNTLIAGFNLAFAPIGLKLGQIPSVHTAKLFGAAGILVRNAGKVTAGLNLFDTTASILTGGPVSGSGSARPVQAFAQGGIVSAATLALIGEGSEPEAVIPLSRFPDMAERAGVGGGGGDIHLHLDGDMAGLFDLVDGRISSADGRDVRVSKMGKQKS